MTTLLRSIAFVVAVAVLCIATVARAEPNPEVRATARSLFDEARRLAAAGDFAAACPKFEESQRLDPGIGTLFNLADCHEHIGRAASAWSNFQEVADMAARAGQAEREKIARERAQKLFPLLSRVTLARSDTDPVEIRFDDTLLGSAAVNAPLPVDPGPHTLTVTAPGRKPWSTRIELTLGESTTVAVPVLEAEVAPTPPSPVPQATPAPLATPHQTPARQPPPTAPDRSGSWQRTFGMAFTGLGVVVLGAGVYAGLLARSQWASAEPHCPDAGCDAEGYQYWQDAQSSAKVSTALFVTGGAVLATGIVLWLTTPDSQTKTAVTLAPSRIAFRTSF